MKYNGICRAGSGIDFLVAKCDQLTLGNYYPTTLNTLSTTILKLGRITPASKVYRAPGGALPASFWRRDPESGVQGGLELAFMSTTVDKEEAMIYARRAPGMILFEIQQGFVARGASIAWLSQYPKEEEILMPPLTALEVAGTRIEGAVVVVELRPTMRANSCGLLTGAEDLERLDIEMQERERHEEERIQREENVRWARGRKSDPPFGLDLAISLVCTSVWRPGETRAS